MASRFGFSGWQSRLEAMDACEAALEWCADQTSLAAAWRACSSGDWLLWLLGRSDLRESRAVFLGCIDEIVGTLLTRKIGSASQRAALADALGLASFWASGTLAPRDLERGCDPDRVIDTEKDPLICRIMLEIGNLPYCGNPTGGVRADVSHDVGSIIAMLVAQVIAVQTPDRHGYPRARAESLAASAAIVRRHFPSPPLIDGLEP